MNQRQIKCPQCGHLTFYSADNLFRPFCSERCRLIDLGAWASESYKVSHTNNDTDHDEDDKESESFIKSNPSENDEDAN